MSQDYFVEYGRKLWAATVSSRLRIGLEYALKRYCAGYVPESWVHLAKLLHEGQMEQINKRMIPEHLKAGAKPV